jgi:16S rRNA (uracil1498-N3)-methyltransferase
LEYYFSDSSNVFLEENKIFLKGDEYHHLSKVLRKKNGDIIQVTDGKHNIYECEILQIDKNKIHCEILKIMSNLNEPRKNIHLYMAILRNMERFEFALEKAVELGINSFSPVITENCQNKNGFSEHRIKRLQNIAKSAMKQSQRCYLPKISEQIQLNKLVKETMIYRNKIVMYEFEETNFEINSKITEDDVYLLVGPEGGFTRDEISFLVQNNWNSLSLGKRKYRAETAAILSVYKVLLNLKNN